MVHALLLLCAFVGITAAKANANLLLLFRPVRNLSRKEFRTPTAPSDDQSKPEYLLPQHPGVSRKHEPSRWSNSQLSELRFESGGNDGDVASINSNMSLSGSHRQTRQPALQRVHSFSTISEQRSVSRAEENKELRVIIDRPAARPKSADGSSLRHLEVPIPNYHLGITRFNTANDVLQNSTHSMDTWNSRTVRNTYLHDRVHHSIAPSIFSGVSAMDLSRSAAVSPDPVVYDPGDTIKPSIFEKLVTVMDDESVVRYVSGTRNISAATPARIVAQISSESFMDYELVSDFFLTFRPYLSAGSLLSLLLARLQWAINRLQEDGRIIRIRTFAALRHWILNYFVDDFVPDFKLRSHFCETINRLYDSVKARQGGGMSDLKILIDLKRCWHGKCSNYWDVPDHHVPYNSPDCPIDPGGDEPTVGDDLQNVAPTHGTQMPGSESRNRPLFAHHDRNDSSTTAKSMPASASSDWSAPAISCSLPPKSKPHKRHSMPFSSSNVPHPVPVIPRPIGSSQAPTTPLSPISARRIPCYGHAHKRSGSFSDSVRDDRTPISLPHIDNNSSFSSQEPCYLGGLIRGELYPPVESYMTMMAPPSPPLPSLSTGAHIDRRNTDGPLKPGSSGSGVKTIIGSIRRAFNGKSPTPGVVAHPVNGLSTRGKTSALPTNVAFQSDLYRDKKTAPPAKKPARIDLLCDEALRQYRRASGENVDSPAVNELAQRPLGQNPPEVPQTFLLPPRNNKTQSRLTGGSESIVIVDDTGAAVPVMSGGVGLDRAPMFLTTQNSPTTPTARTFLASSRGSTLGADEYSLPIYYDEASTRQSRKSSMFYGRSGNPASRRSMSIDRGSSFWKKPSQSMRLRKYASFQSGFSRHRPALDSESDGSAGGSSVLDLANKTAGPILRRRRGGDLRQMKTGVDAHSIPDSASVWSEVTYQSSVADSTARTAEKASRPQTSLVPPKPRFSLLKTNSSQLIRRSFESAIARFAQIPDDEDGGIESALLKLEGKWEGEQTDNAEDPTAGPSQSQERTNNAGRVREGMVPRDIYSRSSTPAKRHQRLGDDLTYSQVQTRILNSRPYSESIVDSEDSYSSIPLLERGLSDESMKKPVQDETSGAHAVFRPIPATGEQSDRESSHPSIDMVKKTESMKRIPRGSTLPLPRHKGRLSRLSGLSSELSADVIDSKEAAEARLSFDTRSLNESSATIPPHPLAHPPSPPMTVQNHRSVHSYRASLNPDLAKAQPLTPDPSPIKKAGKRANLPSLDMQQMTSDVLCRSEADHHLSVLTTAPGAQHVPFVLSCESHILAQQFTLVEMAALGEVDWRDLVDMKWNSGPPFTTSWVQFLMDDDRRGIDLVVGRFNLMVKWVLSEIVLTLDINERARTISKFIHTAAHARRICNYATMLQIAIALTSTDCSRLQNTWAIVSLEDRRMLKDMELLIQPVRNFHDLRVEMETANVQEGCIPFVGMFLLFLWTPALSVPAGHILTGIYRTLHP